MKDYLLRNDLERVVIDGFELPLGIAPANAAGLKAPVQGYTVSYVSGEDDEPDTYSFHVVVSHERLTPILNKVFDLLPDQVYGIIEIGSRDAYRSTDTFIGEELISLDQFRSVWKRYESFLLEDGSIAAGANSEEPFVEVFVDQWKGVSIHVPLPMRDDVERTLESLGLEEVPITWPMGDDRIDDEMDSSQVRPVLDLNDEFMPDVDELLLNLRHDLKLQLNIDPDANLDEGGRDLGSTLWHAVVILTRTESGDGVLPEQGAYASVWATASSLTEMEQMLGEAMAERDGWLISDIYTIDRVAFDERPDDLADLSPIRRKSQIHQVHIEPWNGHNDGSGSGPVPPRSSVEERDER